MELELYPVVNFDFTVELEFQAVARGETAFAKFVFIEALSVELKRLVRVVSTKELLECPAVTECETAVALFVEFVCCETMIAELGVVVRPKLACVVEFGYLVVEPLISCGEMDVALISIVKFDCMAELEYPEVTGDEITLVKFILGEAVSLFVEL